MEDTERGRLSLWTGPLRKESHLLGVQRGRVQGKGFGAGAKAHTL